MLGSMAVTPIEKIARRLHRAIHGPGTDEIVACDYCDDPVLPGQGMRQDGFVYCTPDCGRLHFQSQF